MKGNNYSNIYNIYFNQKNMSHIHKAKKGSLQRHSCFSYYTSCFLNNILECKSNNLLKFHMISILGFGNGWQLLHIHFYISNIHRCFDEVSNSTYNLSRNLMRESLENWLNLSIKIEFSNNFILSQKIQVLDLL